MSHVSAEPSLAAQNAAKRILHHLNFDLERCEDWLAFIAEAIREAESQDTKEFRMNLLRAFQNLIGTWGVLTIVTDDSPNRKMCIDSVWNRFRDLEAVLRPLLGDLIVMPPQSPTVQESPSTTDHVFVSRDDAETAKAVGECIATGLAFEYGRSAISPHGPWLVWLDTKSPTGYGATLPAALASYREKAGVGNKKA